MSGKDVIFVLGYGRSGTSAITRVLSLCGCALPQTVFGAQDMNPKGFWEPVDATNLNVEFLSRHDLASDPSMQLQEIDISDSEKEDYIQRIREFLSSCPSAPLLVIKEFRINELMEFWVEAARREGFSTKVVIAVRHPQEVFASITAAFVRRQEVPSTSTRTHSIETFSAFWLKVNLLAEHQSRCLPRIFVEYSNLMRNWRVEIARISKVLSVDLKVDENAVDGFLTPDLYRQKYAGPVTETFGYSWMTRVYAILSSAAQDGPIDLPSLDEIYHAYRASARTFRMSLNEARNGSGAQLLREHIERLPIWRSGREF